MVVIITNEKGEVLETVGHLADTAHNPIYHGYLFTCEVIQFTMTCIITLH